MAKSSKSITQDILLRVRAPMLPANNGLRQSVELLRQMDSLLRGINQHFSSTAYRLGGFNVRSLQELFKVKGVQTLTPADFNKVIGFTPEAFFSHLAKFRGMHSAADVRKMFRGGDFSSLPSAARFYSWALKDEQKTIEKLFRRAGGHGPSSAPAPRAGAPTQASLAPGQQITLSVPATAIQAVLVGGPIPLQVQGGAASAASAAGTAASGGKSAGKQTPSVPATGTETRRTTRYDKDANIKSVTVEEALAPFHTRATTYAGQDETAVEVDASSARLRAQVNAMLRNTLRDYRSGMKGVTDPRQRMEVMRKAADAIDLITAQHGADLDAMGLGHIRGELSHRAGSVRTEADAVLQGAPTSTGMREMARHLAQVRRRRASEAKNLRAAEDERVANLHAEQQEALDLRVRQNELRNELEMARMLGIEKWKQQRRKTADYKQTVAEQRRVLNSAMPPVIERTDHALPVDAPKADIPAWRKKWFGPTGVGSMSNLGTQMFSNAASVTAWGIPSFAMTAAMGATIGVGRQTGQAAIETSMQTARLSQVFRGAGGDARQLTEDILNLAAAEGRSRKEAMESAIQWARLGTTRRETGEAVRVSLLAANVAEIDSLEATEKLQAVQKAYGLQVRELSGVLGMLNAISNTYNVTNASMLEGLTRTASIARQAGVPLAELVGIMGATIGATGQSGANIGNAMKSILVSLSNPEIQDFLRDRYGLSAKSGGQMKSGSQRLRELWSTYHGLAPDERQNILYHVAGKTQASRMAAGMDNYVTGQILSVYGQRNLQSAEAENRKITAELSSKWGGLVTQFDALVNGMNKVSGATDVLAKSMGAASFAMRASAALLNTPIISRILNSSSVVTAVRLMDQLNARTPEGRRMAMESRLEQQRSNVSSARQMQEFYGTLANVDLSRGEADWATRLMDAETRRRYLDAHAKGDKGGMREALAQASASEALQEKSAKLAQRSLLDTELNSIDADLRQAKARGQVKDIAELEARRKSLTERGVTFYEESLPDEFRESMTQERANAKAAVRYRMSGLAALGGRSGTATGQLFDELRALRRQESMLTDERDRLPADKFDERKDVSELLRDVRASIHARVTGARFAGDQDRNMVARELVKSELDVASVGRDQIEILSNRTRKYSELVELNRQMFASAQTQHDLDRATAVNTSLRAEYEGLILDRIRARAGAAKEEYEANRRLMSMGPRQLLTQLAGQRMAGRVGAGGFLAMSPEMREAIMEQGDRSRRRGFLAQKTDFDDVLRKLTQQESLSRLLEASSAAAVSMGRVGAESATAASSMRQFTDAVNEFLFAMHGGGKTAAPATSAPAVAQAPQELIPASPMPKANFWTEHFDGTQAQRMRDWASGM